MLIAQHMTHVQGHRVKYSNHNNSAADCSVLLKCGPEYDHVTACVHGKWVKGQSHQCNITYQWWNAARQQWIGCLTWTLVWASSKEENDWHGISGLKLQCIAVATF